MDIDIFLACFCQETFDDDTEPVHPQATMGSLNWPFQYRVRAYQAKMQQPRGAAMVASGLISLLICLHSEVLLPLLQTEMRFPVLYPSYF